MKNIPDRKRLNKTFSVRLPEPLVDELYQRAEHDRRTISVTTEIAIKAGLMAMEQPTPKNSKRST
jgi:predicted DNA-binding protein